MLTTVYLTRWASIRIGLAVVEMRRAHSGYGNWGCAKAATVVLRFVICNRHGR